MHPYSLCQKLIIYSAPKVSLIERLLFICLFAGGTEHDVENTKKATEEELSFIKSSICEQWKRIGVGIA